MHSSHADAKTKSLSTEVIVSCQSSSPRTDTQCSACLLWTETRRSVSQLHPKMQIGRQRVSCNLRAHRVDTILQVAVYSPTVRQNLRSAAHSDGQLYQILDIQQPGLCYIISVTVTICSRLYTRWRHLWQRVGLTPSKMFIGEDFY